MLYLTLPGLNVVRTCPDSGSYESFTPSFDDAKEGYIVFGVYTTYDSYSEDNTPRYQVIDIFPDRGAAISCAKTISKKFAYYDSETKIFDAAGDEIKYFSFSGWGNKFKNTVMKKITVMDESDEPIEFFGYE